MGLDVNINKTKYMVISTSERRRNLYNLFIEDNSFDAVSKLRYLGNLIQNDESINTTTHDWIQIRNREYYEKQTH